MLPRLLLALGVVAAAWWLLQRLERTPPEQRAAMLRQGALYAGIVLALLLVATGRLHWVFALLAASIPVLQRLYAVARSLPGAREIFDRLSTHGRAGRFRSGWHGEYRRKPDEPVRGDGPMTPEEAYKVLGLPAGASRNDIVTAHRRLMQKLHPDRGGSDYLAAKINQAKNLLVDR